MTGYRVKRQGPNRIQMIPKKLILFLSLVFFLFWCAALKGIAQKEQDKRWSFETHDQTNFPLTGRHRTVPCRECHWNNVFEGTPTVCEVCHWDRRKDDRYQLRLGTHCADCHNTFSWKSVPPDNWNHGTIVGYMLRGEHRILDCVECHGKAGFDENIVECYGCHNDDFQSSRNPNHQAAEFSVNCWTCHLQEYSWEGAKYSHDFYLLKGMHKLAKCSDCHSTDMYKGRPSACISCHLQDYNNALNPDHLGLGFPTECESCHGSDAQGWEGPVFSHSKFPLKGKHRLTQCADCHKIGVYEGLPSECVFCHLDDYLNAKDPNHKQLGFHTDCEICHGTDAAGWKNSSFSHNSIWSLQGAHTRLDCITCHQKGRNLPRDCFGCHVKEYDASTAPDHKSAGFPSTCENCHLPSHRFWTQSQFRHQIPIKDGKHAHLSCVDCHLSANYRDFSCLNCHAHEKRRMDKKHIEVSGYAFSSQACLACHLQGRR